MKRESDRESNTPQDDSRRARIKRVRDFLKVWRDVRGKDDTICITGAATVLRTSDLLHVIETIDIAQELLDRAKERGELMEVPQFAQSESVAIRVDADALRLAREFVSDPDKRAQVKVMIAYHIGPQTADLIDEAVKVSRELIRIAEGQ